MLTASTLSAQSESLIPAKLTLKDGTTYEGVKVTGMDAIGITIVHDTGIARLALDQFPKEVQDKLGYDPAKAAAQQQEEIARANAIAQQQRAMELKTIEMNQEKAKKEAEARLKAQAKPAATPPQRKSPLAAPKLETPKLETPKL